MGDRDDESTGSRADGGGGGAGNTVSTLGAWYAVEYAEIPIPHHLCTLRACLCNHALLRGAPAPQPHRGLHERGGLCQVSRCNDWVLDGMLQRQTQLFGR